MRSLADAMNDVRDRVGRRAFLAITPALLLLAAAAEAQTAKVHRVGFLSLVGYAPGSLPRYFADGIIRGLGQGGYTLGENLLVEQRGAEGHLERLPTLVAELLAMKVDIIVANS